jgi:hypothetical protein
MGRFQVLVIPDVEEDKNEKEYDSDSSEDSE